MDNTTIIVVDDSPFASKQIKDIVEENGYEVIGYAKNGEEGIKMYEELHPDIVILDIIMPGIDGLETAQILLKNDPNATITGTGTLSLNVGENIFEFSVNEYKYKITIKRNEQVMQE